MTVHDPEQLAARDRVLRQANHDGQPPAPPLPPPPTDDDAPPGDAEIRPDLRLAAAEPTGPSDSGAPNPEPTPARVPSPSDPLAVARQFIEERYTDRGEVELLRHHRGAFYVYDGRCWPEAEDAGLRAELYEHLEHAVHDGPNGITPWSPTAPKIGNVLDALRAVGHLPGSVEPPTWMGDDGPHPADEFLAMNNGLLHLPTRTLHDHDPHLFTHHAVPFPYEATGSPPEQWFAFLNDLWGDDAESTACLQEMFGYWLAGDTRQQKIGLLVGPKRSGKGTIARVVTAMLGHDNVAGPTLNSLAGNFGLQPLLNKPLAIVSDARLGHRNAESVVERLLAISGEDSLTIDRKHRESWTGRLPTRFLILSNELPRMHDTSGALPSRFVALVLTRSFYGQEDPTLTDKLLTEMPGILRWALDGYARLRERGHLTQPTASREAIRELEDLASPMGAFVRDRCTIGAGQQADVDDLYRAWQQWCSDHGRDHPGTKQTFGRDLRAVAPGLTNTQHRDLTGKRYRAYNGIGLTAEPETPV